MFHKLVAVFVTAILFLGLSACAPDQNALPGGGAATVSVSGTTVTINVTDTEGTTVVEAITYPEGSDEVQVDSITGVNPTLVVEVPAGVNSEVKIEIVRNDTITPREVRVSA